jgi:hypothetical protein
MCLMSMQYLILMRPPVRGLALDTIEQMWRDERFTEAKGQTEKMLKKWRPGMLEELPQPLQAKAEVVDMPVKAESIDPRKRGSTSTPIAAGT